MCRRGRRADEDEDEDEDDEEVVHSAGHCFSATGVLYHEDEEGGTNEAGGSTQRDRRGRERRWPKAGRVQKRKGRGRHGKTAWEWAPGGKNLCPNEGIPEGLRSQKAMTRSESEEVDDCSPSAGSTVRHGAHSGIVSHPASKISL